MVDLHMTGFIHTNVMKADMQQIYETSVKVGE